MYNRANIVFMGTPEISVPTLKKLNEIYNIQAVVTIPDKPKGRGMKLQFSPVKEAALELGLNVLQPIKMCDEDFVSNIKTLSPDIIVVFAFRILPDIVYKISKIATFNIHTSLLPKYRGAAPINWAIINGDKYSGLTTFILKEAVDMGDILLQKKIEILDNFTAGDLYDIMMQKAPEIAVETCEMLLNGKYTLKYQKEDEGSNAPKIFRETAKIEWRQEVNKVVNFINGYSPVPCAYTYFDNSIMKIYRTKIEKECEINSEEVGEFFIENNCFYVKCTNGILKVIELQLEGKKRMLVKDFLCGYRGKRNGYFI